MDCRQVQAARANPALQIPRGILDDGTGVHVRLSGSQAVLGGSPQTERLQQKSPHFSRSLELTGAPAGQKRGVSDTADPSTASLQLIRAGHVDSSTYL